METYSQFAGERYATLRAYKSFAKLRLKQEKIKLKTIENLMKDIIHDTKNNLSFNATSVPMRKIKLKLRDYKQSVSDWENIYNFYEQEIKKQDEERQAIIKRAKVKKD